MENSEIRMIRHCITEDCLQTVQSLMKCRIILLGSSLFSKVQLNLSQAATQKKTKIGFNRGQKY